MTRRGLSLIEVVLALVVLGLAAPALLISISAGARQQTAALVQENLLELAAERNSEICADHANPARGYGYIVPSAYPAETSPWGLSGYTRQTEIREVSATDFVTVQAGSGIKRFRVIVRGPGGHAFAIESFVTDIPGAGGGP